VSDGVGLRLEVPATVSAQQVRTALQVLGLGAADVVTLQADHEHLTVEVVQDVLAGGVRRAVVATVVVPIIGDGRPDGVPSRP
jgi:hypothetical protein